MKLAAAYIRVSTDDQTELSPDSQLKQIRDYAKKHDFLVPDEYLFIDEGISGKNTTKRIQFNQMIGIAKTKPKPFDAILLWKFSRFARNREDSVVYKSMLRKQLGIDVISITENLGDDKMSILIEALIEAMDEYYSINLAEEVRRGMTEKVQRGKPVSIAPFGYQNVNQEFVIDQKCAPIVQMIFSDFLNGMGYRQIATKLNAMGITTRMGNHFENRTIQYILTNPVYTGKIRWNAHETNNRLKQGENTIISNGTHEPIIDSDIFEQVQKKVHQIRSKHVKYRREPSQDAYLLKGLVRCSSCGNTLTRSIKTSLQCNGYAKGHCSVSHFVAMHRLNSMAISLIELLLTTGEFELIHRDTEYTQQRDIIEKQIKQEQRKLEKIKEAYYAGADSVEEYTQNKKRVLQTIEHLTSQLPTTKDNQQLKKEFIQKHLESVKTLKNEMIDEQFKNALLLSFVDHMVYNKTTEQMEVFFYQ